MEKMDFDRARKEMISEFNDAVSSRMQEVDMKKAAQVIASGLERNKKAVSMYLCNRVILNRYTKPAHIEGTEAFQKFRKNFIATSGGVCIDVRVEEPDDLYDYADGDLDLVFTLKRSPGFFQTLLGNG